MDDLWYEDGDYDGTQCRCCGRWRVMACDAPDGTVRRVCEKCRKDQETGDYAAMLTFEVKP